MKVVGVVVAVVTKAASACAPPPELSVVVQFVVAAAIGATTSELRTIAAIKNRRLRSLEKAFIFSYDVHASVAGVVVGVPEPPVATMPVKGIMLKYAPSHAAGSAELKTSFVSVT